MAIINAAADILSIFSDFAAAISFINPVAAAIAYGIEAGIHGVLVVVNGALWAYKAVKSGWTWLQGVVTGALKLIGITVQGVPGQLFKLAGDLFGQSVISGGRALGHSLMMGGNAILANVAWQFSMNLDDWCTQYGQDQAACTTS
jgi:hypothetical protein